MWELAFFDLPTLRMTMEWLLDVGLTIKEIAHATVQAPSAIETEFNRLINREKHVLSLDNSQSARDEVYRRALEAYAKLIVLPGMELIEKCLERHVGMHNLRAMAKGVSASLFTVLGARVDSKDLLGLYLASVRIKEVPLPDRQNFANYLAAWAFEKYGAQVSPSRIM